MTTLEIVALLLGSNLLTSVVSPWVSRLANRREKKLTEAQMVQQVYEKLRDETLEAWGLDKQKLQTQGETIGVLRRVIINLTTLLDEILPRISGVTTDEVQRLRAANLEARLAGLAITA